MKFNPNNPDNYSPGTLRDTLGSGLKRSGFFSKDGQIQNMRGGFFGPKNSQVPGQVATPQPLPQAMPTSVQPSGQQTPAWTHPSQQYPVFPDYASQLGAQGQSPYATNPVAQPNTVSPQNYVPQTNVLPQSNMAAQPNPMAQQKPAQALPQYQPTPNHMSPYQQGQIPQGLQAPQAPPPGPRQYVLQAAFEGVSGNGVATITPDNAFLLVATLPQPQTFAQGNFGAVYAAYLVDKKGTSGFMAGILKNLGSGIYQVQFKSPIPLVHYDKVVVSVESPQNLGQAPNGTIVLKVKDAVTVGTFLNPIKDVGGSIFEKISKLIQKKPPAE